MIKLQLIKPRRTLCILYSNGMAKAIIGIWDLKSAKSNMIHYFFKLHLLARMFTHWDSIMMVSENF